MDSSSLTNLLEHVFTRLTNIELKLDKNENDNKNILNKLRINQIIDVVNNDDDDENLIKLRATFSYYHNISELDYFYSIGYLLKENDYIDRVNKDRDVFIYNIHLMMAEIWNKSYDSNWKDIDKLICEGYFDAESHKDAKPHLNTSYWIWKKHMVCERRKLDYELLNFPTIADMNRMEKYFDKEEYEDEEGLLYVDTLFDVYIPDFIYWCLTRTNNEDDIIKSCKLFHEFCHFVKVIHNKNEDLGCKFKDVFETIKKQLHIDKNNDKLIGWKIKENISLKDVQVDNPESYDNNDI